MGEDARRTARLAVEKFPENSQSWYALGLILQYDLIGRHRFIGLDRAGAADALRKAIEINPENKLARADLAILLEHGEQGRRYNSKDYKEAIEYYTKLPDDFLENFQINLLSAYVMAGDFEGLESFLPKITHEQAKEAAPFIVEYGKNGLDAMLAKAKKVRSVEKRRQI